MLYRDRRPLLVFLVPAFLLMLLMLYYPFVMNIYNSFFEIKGMIDAPSTFIGLSNYARFFTGDETAKVALVNSMKMMGLTLVFQVGLSLLLALMVDNIRRGQQFFRVVFFFPIVISATAIGLMFNLFYFYNGGMLNQVREALGLGRVLWMSDERAFTMVAIPVMWQYVGFYFVILLTGLNNIPTEVYESADIDGATGVKKIWYITLPLLRDVIATCVTLAITGAIKVFDLPAVIANNGAPKGLTHLLGTFMYQQTFVAQNVDYGSAVSVVIVVLGVVISRLVSRLMAQRGDV